MVKYQLLIAAGIIVIFILLAAGCETIDESELNATEAGAVEDGASGTEQEITEGTESGQVTTEESGCSAGWKCIDKKIKAYRLDNCSFVDRKECPLGCFNDTCRKSEVCAAGFKCKSEYYRAYQSESCAWLEKTRCDYGCLDGKCKNSTSSTSTNNTETAQTTTTPTIVIETYETLKMGEPKTYSASGIDHNISIYNIDASQVQISIDGKKSEWLTDNSNYTNSGITVYIGDIYFQSYAGGRREITYRIG